MTDKIATICGCCPAGCGVIVEIEGDVIINIKGDMEHPASHGYLCQKGKRIPSFHHRSDRLDHAGLRGVPATWNESLDDLAIQLRRIIEDHGPDSVGLYFASGMGGDAAGSLTMHRFLDGIGSRQKYSGMTVDHAPAMHAQELVTGSFELMPVWVPEEPSSEFVLFVGCNPIVSHGYLTVMPDPLRRIRAFQRRGGQVWVVDPRVTKTAEIANGHIRTRSGTDPVLLAWLVRELLSLPLSEEALHTTSVADRERLAEVLAPFDQTTTSRIIGVETADMAKLLQAIRAAGRVSIVTGTGLLFGANGLVGEWLRWAVLAITGSLDTRGGMWFNPGFFSAIEQRTPWEPAPPGGSNGPGPRSRPELPNIMGEMPCVAMADEIEAGNLRALIVAGGSPLTAFPEPARVARAFQGLDALAVIDVISTPLTDLATHLFPSAYHVERTDVQAWNGRVCLSPRVVPPSADRRPSWEFFGGLGERLGVDVLGGLKVEEADEELLLRQRLAHAREEPETFFAAGSHGLEPPRLYGWTHRYRPDGLWRIAPKSIIERVQNLLQPDLPGRPFRLICKRVTGTKNSNDYAPLHRLRERPAVSVHPTDASASGLAEGDPVHVESEHGAVEGMVRIDPTLMQGDISILHGSNDINVGNLTSALDGVDPYTGNPIMTAVSVSLRPL